MKLAFITALFATGALASTFDIPLLNIPAGETPPLELADMLTELGQSELFSKVGSIFKRETAPTFTTLHEAQLFANSLPKHVNEVHISSLPWGTSKKCTDSTCESCAIGANVFLASGIAACSLKFGPPAVSVPLAGIPALAACITASTGIWYVNLISCLGK
ncbi:hypothetical protein VE01_05746 [Pseudogymnoascus verrucosus]|uniref:Uncharacterized protein n=1 Tax=Pseudogymnoascus verrucosus TaxID=342668 RepID=A0A1B8GKL1_9PEZI|nr:uncharacterized protein VE01_05746 [Pseudogymnoascus verrucosus]OBT96318.1 hypothetical protein VE01_05746 [Pseudogymnoascus verrucosus]